ncbi:MAG: GumC family protein [Thermodesulfobacteriota bacterium]
MDYSKQVPAFPSEQYDQFPQPVYASPSSHEPKEVELRDYWKVILKRKWTIVSFTFIVLLATGVMTFTMRPIYRSTATIQINKENPQVVDFKEIFSVNTMEMDYYQTQYRILESRTLAKRVIHSLKLSEHPEFLPKPETAYQAWKSKILNLFSGSSSSPREETSPAETKKEILLINQFLNRLKIEPIRNSRLVKIHFDSNYPELSVQVANAVATTYMQQNLEIRFITTEKAKEWLTGQLQDLKAKVERADEDLQVFGSKHDIISLDEKENVTLQRLTELNEALTKAESDRIAKEAIYRQIRGKNIDSLPPILENKLISDLKQAFIQLEAQYVKQLETLKPDHPEMTRLKKQMEILKARLDGEIGKIAAGLKNDYESALKRESLLRQAFEQQKKRVMEMKEKAIQYNILKREADTNRELYKGLLQRMKEAGISAGITASNIQVVDQAELPIKPHKPKKALNLTLAFIVGLFLGMGLAFFFEYLDNSVKTPEDVEQLVRLPFFGLVPGISHERRKRVDRENSYPVELITYGHPKSMLSEAYRNIRTSILLSFSGKPPKKIVISSPNPAEGKTTTVINTAIALSQTGARVLIIEADLRKPRISRIFEQENGIGLSNFLSGNAELDSIIRKTEIPNLFCILSGPVPPNPSELLGSVIFKNMIESLGERFDHLVIDAPPILGFADSIILSTSVDGVILVVQGGKTPRETLQRAKDVLSQVNARILGVVINRVNIQGSGYDGYGYYYYRYHSYYGEKSKQEQLPHIKKDSTSV